MGVRSKLGMVEMRVKFSVNHNYPFLVGVGVGVGEVYINEDPIHTHIHTTNI